MKTMRAALGLVVFVFGTCASVPALAWHHGGHARIGVVIGAPVYWYPPYYYYPPYYPPVVAVPSAPPTYIEQGETRPAPSQSNWWYYCADTKAYYPYVKECPAGWQRVAPRP